MIGGVTHRILPHLPGVPHLHVNRGQFLESPDSQRARLAVSVYFKDRGFNSFASNMIKLSVNETKWSSLLAWTRGLILYISIWILDFGPEKLPGLSRNGPQALKLAG